MHKSKIKQITLAVCLAFMPFSGYAAGLGKLNVTSGLGEPLKAEIELLSVTPDELSTLVAAIASEEAYAAQGVTRLGIHNNIQVEVSKNTSGSPILRLRSTVPISDPYLDMLIQVDWASGRLQREYTVLLDPPGYKQAPDSTIPMAISPATTNNTRNAPPPQYQSGSTQVIVKKSTKPSKASGATEDNVADSANVDEIRTQRGDNLSVIAREMQVEGVSLDQMLVGLYENNKSAFEGNNINRLKVGQIIRVPSKEVLTGIDRKDASQTVKVHSANWMAYRNNLAGVVTEAPAMAESEQKQAASGKISAAEDKAAAVKAGPQDVVKLSAGESVKASNNSAKEFEAKITALQEETTAREKSLKEAQERTAALEKQIQDMQKLLALKNQAMTEAQQNAEAASQNAPAVTAPVAEAPAPAAVVVQNAEPANSSETSATTSTEPAKPVVTTVPAQPKVVAPPQVAPEPEEGFLATINNMIDLTILAAIAGIALLGGVWMFLRNKRRRDLDSFERGILTSGGLRANTVFGNTTGTASTSDTSFLTDFAQSADGSMIDTNDVDPIAEAEVYMAYGRDAQAEEILKDAISKEPKRYELHLKLLEMYAARKDTSAFEAIAGELYTTLGADDPTWIKVAEIGHTMEPENPLYDVGSAVVGAAAATQILNAADFANVPVKEDADLDFSLGDEDQFDSDEQVDANNTVKQSFSTAPDTDSELSFDLGSFEPESNALPVNSAEEIKSSVVDNAMDFDLGTFDLNTETAQDDETLKTMDNLTAFNMPESNEISFEAPSFEMPAPTAESTPDESFDMDFNFPEPSVSDPMGGNTINDLSFDLSSTESEHTDVHEISFEVPALDDEPAIQEDHAILEELEEANTFDLSNISLELNDTPVPDATPEPVIDVLSVPESPDVDIKLDLVAAYLDMNDKEGARELLDEVLKDGGPQQQAKAKDLLASFT